MQLLNPYLDLFQALPGSFRRDPLLPPSATELLMPDWLALKATITRHFAWAVPTDEAIAVIRKHTTGVVEAGAGSGYWTWLMRQAGLSVAAFDLDPPPFTWTEVSCGDERMVRDHSDKALLLCWPPWGSGMAANALDAFGGEQVIYIGEWMGGSADPHFFTQLVSGFDCIDVVEIPQWYMRDDRLMVFRRHT
ncbi:hypothetical protein SAMN05444161_5005 [Rhizobiales bacterium GAS191]|nr:hypothetical protein SAMN05444161_5005 [Rhizobiales bacterium GAS191]